MGSPVVFPSPYYYSVDSSKKIDLPLVDHAVHCMGFFSLYEHGCCEINTSIIIASYNVLPPPSHETWIRRFSSEPTTVHNRHFLSRLKSLIPVQTNKQHNVAACPRSAEIANTSLPSHFSEKSQCDAARRDAPYYQEECSYPVGYLINFGGSNIRCCCFLPSIISCLLRLDNKVSTLRPFLV